MTQESAITPEMKAAIDVESEPLTHDVEKGAIIKFAEAIGDTNPIFNDEVAARKSRYGGMVAPPTFLRSINPGPLKVEFRSPYTANLDGGSEWEYFEPIRPGDRITVTTKIADLYERAGRLGQHAVHGARDQLREPVRQHRCQTENYRDKLPAA